jgi:hypothetical protein
MNQMIPDDKKFNPAILFYILKSCILFWPLLNLFWPQTLQF